MFMSYYFSKENILAKIASLEEAYFKALQAESYSVGDGQTNTSISRASVSDLQKQIKYWVDILERHYPEYKSTKDVFVVQSNLSRKNF